MTSPLSGIETTRTVTTPDGAELRAYLSGPADAAVTVVLSHGWTLASSSWRRQVAALTGGRPGLPGGSARVVRWEQRGHGGSTLGARRPSIDLLGEDLAQVVEELAPEGPVVLGGHSMGGMTIMALAAGRPELVAERVAGVALVSTSGGHLNTALPGYPMRARTVAACQRGLMSTLARSSPRIERTRALAPPRLAAHRAMVKALLFGQGTQTDVVLECAELVHATPADVIALFYPALMEHDKIWRLKALREVPVAILAGNRDRLIPFQHSVALRRALPDARLDIVPGLGHMLPMEAPDLVADRLADLCAARDRGA